MKHLYILLALTFSSNVIAAVQHTVGVARDADDQTIRYFEHHQYLDDGQHLIRYYTQDLELIAFKNLKYGAVPQHPEIAQANLLDNTQVTIKPEADSLTMVRTTGDNVDEIQLPLDLKTVIDAGFDAYVRDAWDEITRAAPTQVRFAIAGQRRTLAMQIIREEDYRFTIRPNNWLIRSILPKIHLEYDDQRRLSRYQGFSNFSPSSGESMTVNIEFTHFELDQELDRPPMEWIYVLRSDPLLADSRN